MHVVGGLLFVTGFCPLTAAWWANERTTLRPALLWAAGAWAAWTWAAWEGGQLARYAALCLSGCSGVAVLGARRPGVGAWNFVVLGLLAVLLRPLAEGLGELRLDEAHLAFLATTLAVPLVNYLPTRLAMPVLLLGAGCGVELARLAGADVGGTFVGGARVLVGVAPWVGWAVCRRGGAATEFDLLWLGFRDRFGLVWGQRVREQFNRAAANAGWPVFLTWRGLRPTGEGTPPDPALPLAALRAVLKRFGPAEREA